MSEAIIVALVTGGLMLIGNIITAVVSNSKVQYRIQQLEIKQDKYNNLQERTLVNETNIKHLQTEMNDLKGELKQ